MANTPPPISSGPNWKNRTLYHGDNLKFLRAMNSNSVHLIATDPPFNKGRDFHATPDSLASGAKFQDRWSWERDVHQDWLDKIKDDYPAVWEVIDAANAVYMRKTKKNLKRSRDEVGSDMGAFLCFMAVRLLEMYRVLRDDGSIFLHCDPTASHYLKAVMDAIFGQRNFRNEIVWCYIDPAGRRNTDYYKKTHDFIFWYAKDTKKCKTNYLNMVPLSESTRKRYGKYFDAQGQITYASLKMTNPGVFAALKGVPNDLSEVWMDRNKGTVAGDWWTDITPVRRKGGKQEPTEQVLWPTQKPLKLYRRLVETASCKDDIVLDPFAGCATACIAAEQLNRQWVAIDIWAKAKAALLHRLESEGMMQKNPSGQGYLFAKDVLFTSQLPERTDGGEEAAPFLRVKERIKEPEGRKMSRADMYEFLLTQQGCKCQGCDRTFDDPRYLELDHNTPRSDGGLNHISNRILLCGPCNKLKSNTYTLSGLRRQNKKLGYMRK